MINPETFHDWFYREYQSTPERKREYHNTGVLGLMQKAYKAGQVNGSVAMVSNESAELFENMRREVEKIKTKFGITTSEDRQVDKTEGAR